MSDGCGRLSDFVDLHWGGGCSSLTLSEEEGEVVSSIALGGRNGVVLLGSAVEERRAGHRSGGKRYLRWRR